MDTTEGIQIGQRLHLLVPPAWGHPPRTLCGQQKDEMEVVIRTDAMLVCLTCIRAADVLWRRPVSRMMGKRAVYQVWMQQNPRACWMYYHDHDELVGAEEELAALVQARTLANGFPRFRITREG